MQSGVSYYGGLVSSNQINFPEFFRHELLSYKWATSAKCPRIETEKGSNQHVATLINEYVSRI